MARELLAPEADNARLVARNRLATQIKFMPIRSIPRIAAVETGSLVLALAHGRLAGGPVRAAGGVCGACRRWFVSARGCGRAVTRAEQGPGSGSAGLREEPASRLSPGSPPSGRERQDRSGGPQRVALTARAAAEQQAAPDPPGPEPAVSDGGACGPYLAPGGRGGRPGAARSARSGQLALLEPGRGTPALDAADDALGAVIEKDLPRAYRRL